MPFRSDDGIPSQIGTFALLVPLPTIDHSSSECPFLLLALGGGGGSIIIHRRPLSSAFSADGGFICSSGARCCDLGILCPMLVISCIILVSGKGNRSQIAAVLFCSEGACVMFEILSCSWDDHCTPLQAYYFKPRHAPVFSLPPALLIFCPDRVPQPRLSRLFS